MEEVLRGLFLFLRASQELLRRLRITTAMTISTTPTTSTIGPIVAQSEEPLMTDPPRTFKP